MVDQFSIFRPVTSRDKWVRFGNLRRYRPSSLLHFTAGSVDCSFKTAQRKQGGGAAVARLLSLLGNVALLSGGDGEGNRPF